MNLLSRRHTTTQPRRGAWRRAFSTLGCAGAPLDSVVEIARRGGWQGLEFRAAPGEPVHVGLSASAREQVRATLADADIEALAVASYVEIDDPSVEDSRVVEEALEHLQLAHDLRASFVRAFPGGPSTDGAATRRLEEIAARLDGLPDVVLALETHDSCATGVAMGELLAHVGHPRIRAVWDVQHPWRAGEAVKHTLEALMPVLAYVQITDARSIGDPTPSLLGEGALPLREARDELVRSGYDGWISLEWASYWYPDAPPLEAALPGAARWVDGSLWDRDV
jgi:sugar phosphate isomerase/epimerase